MPTQLARKPHNTYHHGDLRDALIKAALREAEQGGPEGISIKALAKELGVSQPAPYRHFADREALLAAVTAEAFRQFTAMLREAIEKPSKRSKLSRLAQATLDFGLRRNGIYRLMFASRAMSCAAKGSELHKAASETFALVLEALEAPAVGYVRERQALKIWAALHGVVMLAEQGMLTGEVAHATREELVDDFVAETKLALEIAFRDATKSGKARVARSPRSSAASAPSASFGTTCTVAGNSGGIETSVGGKVESRPIRVPIVTACSIMASLGLSTGIGACARATASMHGPKAEQVNRMASAPVAAA
jgi:AcrR family transcriptional regulator